jgi:Domain of unknown function (DUF4400)
MAQMRRDGNADGVKSFFWMLDLGIHVALWLIAITFLSVIADEFAAWTWWRDDPVRGVEALVQYYLEQTTDPDTARQAADLAYWSWFGWTGIDASAHTHAANATAEHGWGGALGRMISGDGAVAVTVAMYGVKLSGIRIAMLVMTLPQFVMSMLVALTDGLVARYVRRVRGGHESATRYHHARRLFLFGLLPVVATVWIVAPIPMPIEAFFWPVSMSVFFALRAMAKFYKKYV